MSQHGSGSGGGSARSILARLAHDVGSEPRVELEPDAEEGPDIAKIALRHTGRYEVIGEIAVGGVGRVLKGRDGDLCRDVAIKTLRDRHVDNAEIVRRFVEEAQIGGQLQHPGIVPVYELGVHGDDLRPFLAMKLVKGKTLAALLADRKDLTEDRRRFVAIFEQVCQAMAYAHARGVVHRDLKPSNVMIGPFGEVQILDWGFAKVLAQGGVADERRARRSRTDVTVIATVRSSGNGSESVAGSVMGTPAYMPPEQALGQVELLDERSDVFCLGGILCAILTGEPPYVGAADELLVLAARGVVDDAFARLDDSDANPALIDLAKRCLAPLKRERPRDAGAVARDVSSYQLAAEDMARQAEFAAIDARRRAAAAREAAAREAATVEVARAQAERETAKAERAARRAEEAERHAAEVRRSRLLTLALATVVVLLAVAAVAGYLSKRGDDRGRLEASTSHVEELLMSAELLAGRQEFSEAMAAVEQALGLAAVNRIDAGVLQAAATLRDDIEASRLAAARADASERRRGAVREALETVRLRCVPEFDAEALDRAFSSVFEKHGIAMSSGSRQDVVARIRALDDAADDVVAALDEWAWMRRTRIRGDTSRALALSSLANDLDPDPTRTSIRSALAGPDVELLLMMANPELTEPEVIGGWPARTISLLGYALWAVGEEDAGIGLLQTGWNPHAGDVWINLHLARAFESLDPPRHEFACRYFTAAWALRPASSDLRAAVERTRGDFDVLAPIRERLGYHDSERYLVVDVSTSAMTEQRQRIYAEKAALVGALLAHEGKPGFLAEPLRFADGTTFVAESLNEDGDVVGTQMTVLRRGRDPQFLAFDAHGALQPRFGSFRFPGGGAPITLPAVCVQCHTSQDYYEPMMSFPEETGFRRAIVDESYRDLAIVQHFLEGYHRAGGPVRGPYASMYMSWLKSGARAGTLSESDRDAYEALLRCYPDLLSVDE